MIDPGSGDEHEGELASGLSLAPVAVERTRVATTLYSRLVGVTAGLGVPSTLTWNGSSNTVPEIPAGVASTAMTNAAARATSSVQPGFLASGHAADPAPADYAGCASQLASAYALDSRAGDLARSRADGCGTRRLMSRDPQSTGAGLAVPGTCGEGCAVAVAGSRDERWLRAASYARWLAWVSLAWMTAEGAVGLIAGFTAGSIALVGWALGSVIEALASVIVVWRFTGSRTLSLTAERRAQKAVAVSFWLLAPYVVVEAIRDLAGHHQATATVLGIVVTASCLCSASPNAASASACILAPLPVRGPRT
jgi:hypothetical protein